MRPKVFRVDGSHADAVSGNVVWAPAKSLWINGCLLGFVLAAPFATTLSAVLLFFALTYLTLLLGHSVGMHRKLIHQTYQCPKALERFLVYLGVLVGMAGPFGLIRVHDIRDWAQREQHCHDFFSHRRSLLVDAFWQLNCTFKFDAPPSVKIEDDLYQDKFYQFLEYTWMLQQLPLAVVLFAVGGWPWVVWGIFARVFISVSGHWVVTYLTHNPGPGNWLVPAAGVQASNLNGTGFITMGECWHNNHHAFPESARMGLDEGQPDPGWRVISCLEWLGLVWAINLPRADNKRDDLVQLP